MIAAASEISAAQCAFILNPPRSMNSTTIGIAATSALVSSELPTGSSTCLYIPQPPVRGLLFQRSTLGRAALRSAHSGRAVRHVLQRHAVPGYGPGGRGAARAPRGGGGVPRGPDLLRPDARQLGLRG